METGKPEYQHFIPQFLLRNFSHKYVPPNKTNGSKPKKRGKKNKMYPGDDVINSLCLSDEYRIDECLVRRVCGVENMYVDTTKPAKEQGKLEKKFGVLENRASCVYRKIIKAYEEGKSEISLKRSEKDILRKFIFLLTYRGEQYHRKYNLASLQEYDDDDKELLQDYMTKHGFTRPIDVWLQSLETIIDLDMDAQRRWMKSIFKSVYFPIADFFASHIDDLYMAICTPTNPDEEFVLTDNCYNVSEGPTTSHYDEASGKYITKSPRFHMFAPISPRLMLVLRNGHLPEPTRDADPEERALRELGRQLLIDGIYGSGTKSMLEDLPIRKASNSYSHFENGILMPNAGWNQQLGMNDQFCFTFTKISTSHVQKINGLLIDHAFHGSRIVFNRKDSFMDLVEWYLTEPCEVGKNLLGEHVAAQAAYIAGLSQFMLREGRALEPKMEFWPSEHRDLRQHRIENLAGARFLEQARLGEPDAGGFDAIYERLGGTEEAFNHDVAMSIIMFGIWTRCVDLDWHTPDYERLRSNKLDWLLDGFLRRQSSYPVIQGRELNEAMYKSFNKSMGLISGPGRGLESIGHFSLFGDPRWRIPTTAPIERWPWNRGRVNDGPDFVVTILAPLAVVLDRMASTNCDGHNQHPDAPEAEDVDTSGLKEAAQPCISRDIALETPTGAAEGKEPDNHEETQEVPDALKRAARAFFRGKKDNGTPTIKCEEPRPVDKEDNRTPMIKCEEPQPVDKEDNRTPTIKCEEPQPVDNQRAQQVPDANEQVHPEQPQNESRQVQRERYASLSRTREACRNIDTHTKIDIIAAFAVLVFAWNGLVAGCLFACRFVYSREMVSHHRCRFGASLCDSSPGKESCYDAEGQDMMMHTNLESISLLCHIID
ncbi:hypothetical protein V8C26DRAFT_422982 [Trichoderma gracile]